MIKYFGQSPSLLKKSHLVSINTELLRALLSYIEALSEILILISVIFYLIKNLILTSEELEGINPYAS